MLGRRRLGLLLIGALVFLGGLRPAPAEAETPRGRWIDVDLTTLSATAYEGDRPVKTVQITSGKPGFETPTGTFYIQRRVLSETMDSETVGIPRSAPEGYYLKDVRYTQYISSDGTALHSNYWVPDSVFGNKNTSHGCVGMRTADAAFFWEFASVGTPVVIHRGATNSAGAQTIAVPSLVGLSVEDAEATLAAAGLRGDISWGWSDALQPGRVAKQSPAVGTALAPDGTVALAVSRGVFAGDFGCYDFPPRDQSGGQGWRSPRCI